MIDKNAIIDPSAQIAEGVTVGPGAIIGAKVVIGEGTTIGPYAVIKGPTVIGKHNKIFQFASIGDEPQDINYDGEDTRLEIGDYNTIREYCMINRGTVKGGGVTRIGNHNFLMAYAHIGHDCQLGDHIIMVNYAALAGHVEIGDYVNIGPYAAVHQFCKVGRHAFISRATYVTKDVVPYVMVVGPEATTCGINSVGIKRRGFSVEAVDALRKAYKIVFRKSLTTLQAVSELEAMQSEHPEVIPLIDAINQSTRGIVR
ncbi:acyl-ACP--UDP-N-acetylglucosamine O-acyltransferase [Legionella sp. W05-934-2]|uniref:acyl-ACP--UDP-N-acetylglucosamine O-acyltransferase n=1 Tax=Legionella sp. W05-934-2 TaxID=1198649 RepID=UPI0034624CCD